MAARIGLGVSVYMHIDVSVRIGVDPVHRQLGGRVVRLPGRLTPLPPLRNSLPCPAGMSLAPSAQHVGCGTPEFIA